MDQEVLKAAVRGASDNLDAAKIAAAKAASELNGAQRDVDAAQEKADAAHAAMGIAHRERLARAALLQTAQARVRGTNDVVTECRAALAAAEAALANVKS